MTTPIMPAEVVDNGDGTFMVADPYADWLIYDTGHGWVVSRERGTGEAVRFATSADAACAVLRNIRQCRLFDGRLYGEVWG